MRIAIIGGIGSGKSTVLNVAKELGLATVSADEINAQLLKTPEYILEISKAFPSAVQGGEIDRKKLADIVFSDIYALKTLNEIAHPQILKRIKEDKGNPLVAEMPLLVEIGAQNMFDEIVVIYAPYQARVERLQLRGVDKDEAERRICAQADENSLKSVATRTIDNSGNFEELRKNSTDVFRTILTENGFKI